MVIRSLKRYRGMILMSRPNLENNQYGCESEMRLPRTGGLKGRVARGDCSPRAPTDPDLRISRIRLVTPWCLPSAGFDALAVTRS